MIKEYNMKSSLRINKLSHMPYYKNISFEVDEGEIAVISGDEGSGKSTLLSILAGIITPSEGTVSLAGNNIAKSSCNIGYVYDSRHYSYVCDNCPAIYGKNYDYNYVIINHMLNTYGYMYYASNGSSSISFIINSMLNFPDVILIDEPYYGKDECYIRRYSDALGRLVRTERKICVITADKKIVKLCVADKIINLNKTDK